ncbi:flagellar basal-body rod protein FlgG [Metallumcola ferriviriculae]|uniref:Flagellar basal-body rod protein FlgG n=1 Tax=Metallumcola ferriviriculae TaxID=3039180 RepID=A0AAU0USP6_9FIRM|nr:flagellar basal-body rod protein FlgG [Desulfitibacteraceae bacterium MK1]
MLKSLWTGASGMNAQMHKMDNIADNLANVNTNGYKKGNVSFADLVYQQKDETNMPVSYARLVPSYGSGVKVSSVTKVFLQGNLNETGRSLDLAIEGKGFFAVKLPGGEMGYTRDGSFNVDSDGRLVNNFGLYLNDDIEVPEDAAKLRITPQGIVSAIDNQGNEEEIGNMNLYKVKNLAGLKAVGRNLYQTTEASGAAEEASPGEEVGYLRQGFLESSNVDLAEEMVNMISAQRAYEISSRTVKTADEMWGIANNIRR